MNKFTFSSRVILRTPLQEVETDINWEKIEQEFQCPMHQEALLLASPVLYQRWRSYKENPIAFNAKDLERLKVALYKYYARLSNRCTPFGLFAGLSVLNWSDKNHLQISEATVKKATKLDTFFLAQLHAFLMSNAAIRKQLKYYPNSSIYKIGLQYRYVEYYYKENQRQHKISSVEQNDIISLILAKVANGLNYTSIINLIKKQGFDQNIAENFLNQLIDSQFLISEIAINLTGEGYLNRLITLFEEKRGKDATLNNVYTLLMNLGDTIKQLEALDTPIETYFKLAAQIKQQFNNVQLEKLFQVDLFKNLNDNTLSSTYLKSLRVAVQLIERLSVQTGSDRIKQFINKFSERYDEQERPLTEVLDPDVGIAYVKILGPETPLVDGLAITKKQQNNTIAWGTQNTFLLKKLLDAYKNGDEEIKLTPNELNTFKCPKEANFDTSSILFSIFSENQQEKLFIKHYGGPTAAGLLGRFTHLDKKVDALAQEIFKTENTINKDKIVAELVHLPQDRTGNVLHRKTQRDFEIPYLGYSSLPPEQQIPVPDLMISIKNGKIVLRSASKNKEIIPRLSNAHNYNRDALPIYHFLCDLAWQQQSTKQFSWGQLQYESPFLPRVSFKNIVLARASWLLNKEEIKELLKHRNDYTFLQDLLRERNIPSIILVSNGDNELIINFDNPLSRTVFFNGLKNKNLLVLKEFLFHEKTVTGRYANEFIATTLKKQTTNKSKQTVSINKNRKIISQPVFFSPGSEWIYYKVYCGEKSMEKVLTQSAYPIIKKLQERQWLKKWFFVRFKDHQGFHLRLRFHLYDRLHFSESIMISKNGFKAFENNGIIWKTQLDTYEPEVDRYGQQISLTEQLFHFDSEMALTFIRSLTNTSNERKRWLFALASMDELLDNFSCSTSQKLAIINRLKASFDHEFNRHGLLHKQINDLYRKEQQDISIVLEQKRVRNHFMPIWWLLQERSSKQSEAIKKLISLDQKGALPSPLRLGILPSHLHMICNRIFLSKHRIHEMVVYDFLYKYYSKKMHLQKATKKPLTESV